MIEFDLVLLELANRKLRSTRVFSRSLRNNISVIMDLLIFVALLYGRMFLQTEISRRSFAADNHYESIIGIISNTRLLEMHVF